MSLPRRNLRQEQCLWNRLLNLSNKFVRIDDRVSKVFRVLIPKAAMQRIPRPKECIDDLVAVEVPCDVFV